MFKKRGQAAPASHSEPAATATVVGKTVFEPALGSNTLVFGLDWHALVLADSKKEIAQEYKKRKALGVVEVRHEPPVAGFMTNKPPKKTPGVLVSASMVFATQIAGSPLSGNIGVLLYRITSDIYFACVVVRGSPEAEFVGSAADAFAFLQEFTDRYPTFSLYADPRLGDIDLVAQTFKTSSYHHFDGFTSFGPVAIINPLKREVRVKGLVFTLVFLGVLGYVGYDVWEKNQPKKKKGPSPEQLYQRSRDADMAQRSIVATESIGRVWGVVRAFPAAPAGWRLSKVDCKVVQTSLSCIQSFARQKHTTNEALKAAKLPADPAFGTELDRATVNVTVALSDATTVDWRDGALITFGEAIIPNGAVLQRALDAGMTASVKEPSVIGVLGELPPTSPLVRRAGSWEIKGGMDAITRVQAFPPFNAVASMTVEVPEDDKRDIEINIGGVLYVR